MRAPGHAVNGIGWPVSSSANVPVTRVGSTRPFSSTRGPRPQGRRNGPDGVSRAGTPGIVTPEICSGACAGVNLNASALVRIGAKRSTPDGPSTPPRAWPRAPETRTGSGPSAPGGRWIVTMRTVRRCRQEMVSTGWASPGLAIQLVAGFPSKADLGWSCAARLYRDDAPTRGCPAASRRYLLISEGASSTAEPRSAAGAAAGPVNAWSNPYCSSTGRTSAGEHTQRAGVRMHGDASGWALASTTAAGRTCGTPGATMTRPACTPGTVISLIPTWAPTSGCGCAARPVTVIRSQPVGPGGTRSGWGRPVTWTRSVRLPAAVVTATWVTAGPSAVLSVKAASITRGSRRAPKLSWSHCPTGPVRLPDSHIVRMSPSTAEYGSSPLAHWPGIASIPAADEDAVTFLMPVYRATLR